MTNSEIIEDTSSVKLELPLEIFTIQKLLRGKKSNLAYWFIGELLFSILLLSLAEFRSVKLIIENYWVIILVGALAINGNTFFYLYISEKCRELLTTQKNAIFQDKNLAITTGSSKIYGRFWIMFWQVTTLLLGIWTFLKLRLSTPIITSFFLYLGLVFAFLFVGRTIGFIFNIWGFFKDLAKIGVHIQPLHEDRMGGLKPLTDLNLSIMYLGTGIMAIYSLGAYITPYANQTDKGFAYLWILGAIILFNIGLFWPTIRIHKLLVIAKQQEGQLLTDLKYAVWNFTRLSFSSENLLNLNNSGNTETVKEIDKLVTTIKYFQGEITQMAEWPYQSLVKTVLSIISIQSIVPIITNWDKIKIFVEKLVTLKA